MAEGESTIKLTKRKGFNFFRSYYDVFNELDDKGKLEFIKALLDKQFLGVAPENLTGMVRFAYISQMHSINQQVKGYEDKTGDLLGDRAKTPPLNTPPVPPSVGLDLPPTLQEEVEEKGEEKEKGSNGEALPSSPDTPSLPSTPSKTFIDGPSLLTESKTEENPLAAGKGDVAPPKKKKYEPMVFSKEVHACYLECLKHFPEQFKPKKREVQDRWMEAVDKCNRIDGYEFHQIEAIVKYTRNDDWWVKTFQSLTKLRVSNKEEVLFIHVFRDLVPDGKLREVVVKDESGMPWNAPGYKI